MRAPAAAVTESVFALSTKPNWPNNTRLGIAGRVIPIRKTESIFHAPPKIFPEQFEAFAYLRKFFLALWQGPGIYFIKLALSYDVGEPEDGEGDGWEQGGYAIPREALFSEAELAEQVESLLAGASLQVPEYLAKKSASEKVRVDGATLEFIAADT